MSKRFNLILLMTLLIVLVGLSSLLMYDQKKSLKKIKKSTHPDAYLENSTTTRFGVDGKITSILKAPFLFFYNNKNRVIVEKPNLAIYGKSGSPWYITADHGTYLVKRNKVNFYGHVNIHRAASDSNRDTTMLTTTLDVWPNKGYAKTAAPVIIIQPGTKVDAKGMEAYLKTEVIHLLANARGNYVPEKHHG